MTGSEGDLPPMLRAGLRVSCVEGGTFGTIGALAADATGVFALTSASAVPVGAVGTVIVGDVVAAIGPARAVTGAAGGHLLPGGAPVVALPVGFDVRASSHFMGLERAHGAVGPRSAIGEPLYVADVGGPRHVGTLSATDCSVRGAGGIPDFYGAAEVELRGVGAVRPGDAGAAVATRDGRVAGLAIGTRGGRLLVAPIDELLATAGMTLLTSFEAARHEDGVLEALRREELERLRQVERERRYDSRLDDAAPGPANSEGARAGFAKMLEDA